MKEPGELALYNLPQLKQINGLHDVNTLWLTGRGQVQESPPLSASDKRAR